VTSRLLRWAAWGAVVSTALWPLLPVLAAHVSWLRSPVYLLERWFALHCARDSERTPLLGAVRLGVCARCAGIYWGLGLGALVRRPMVSGWPVRFWMVLAALLMLADVVAERVALHGSWPEARIATGMLLAYPCGLLVGARLLASPRATVHKP